MAGKVVKKTDMADRTIIGKGKGKYEKLSV
jgi:hypothetical protein